MVLATLCLTPARAQAVTPVTPLGIPICDAFLDAYARCANGPGIPDEVRPGLRQAINTTREGYRANLTSDRARRTIEVQCAQSHAITRERLVQAYRCDFAEPSAEAKALTTQGRPAAGRP